MKNKKQDAELNFYNRSIRLGFGYFAFCFSLFAFNFLLSSAALAQSDVRELAPPPLKIISKNEILRLNEKSKIKDRTKLSLELMKDRLAAAEKLTATADFDGMFRELGVFHGIMDDAVAFLDKRESDSGKVLDNFKRLEIGLRAFGPRIAVIHRELPLKYEHYVRKLMAYLRDARTTATESLFDDTVVPQLRPGSKN